MNKVIIIGAGIAGLAAGILAQQNGFETEIFEMHDLPGGLCTAWKRRGYTFDGCIRYVYGSAEGKMLSALMRRIGAAGTREYIHHEESIRIETRDGTSVIIYCDLDKLQPHLIDLSPEDEKQIRGLIRAARSMSRADIPFGMPSGLRDIIPAIMHFLPPLMRYSRVSLKDFADGLKDPALREAFLHYYGYAKLDDLPLFVLIMDLAEHHSRNAGWPLGGSLELMRDVEKEYISAGGKVHYGFRVERILTTGGRASGVLAGGREFPADSVICAADAYTALEGMLGGGFTPQKYSEAFRSEKPITPVIQVSLGISSGLSGIPHNQAIALGEPIEAAGIKYDWLSFRHYGYDRSMAPEGKSVIVAMLETDFSVWDNLGNDKKRYAAEKESIASQVIARLDERYPGLKEKVEVCDVATPLTYRRYTGNREGSPQGWQTTVGHMGNFPNKLPELKNFYMAGQWVRRGGGLPGGAMSAMSAVKALCKDSGRRFK
ncbi:MAG: Phytoene desaturase (lycopene-forming) [Firmicutes bacterium ADurb.Bin182]|nr:MAG: Phytoene desaturase (lycopene-forming) [Firmicutes bacterium ADurb.Bin182]